MSARRVSILITCLVVAVLAIVLVVVRWDDASRIATIISALAAVAAVGVAVWAALAPTGARARASKTGAAVARGRGSRANTGVTGPAGAAEQTGDARAAEGGSANSGIER
jgi:hypothetical protein